MQRQATSDKRFSIITIFIVYICITNVSSLLISHSIHSSFRKTSSSNSPIITGFPRKSIIVLSKTNENVWKEIKSSFEIYWSSLRNFISSYKDKSSRQQVLSEIRNGTEVIVGSVIRNSQVGEVGKRGEEFVATTSMLVLLTFLGVHPIISLIFRFAGFISFLSGLVFVSTSILEMKEQISFLLIPVANQRLVSTGIYQVVRHPMYGGLLSVCLGIAMLNRSAEKVLFSIALGFILERKIEKEEELLQQVHKEAYVNYERTTPWRMIPFVI